MISSLHISLCAPSCVLYYVQMEGMECGLPLRASLHVKHFLFVGKEFYISLFFFIFYGGFWRALAALLPRFPPVSLLGGDTRLPGVLCGAVLCWCVAGRSLVRARFLVGFASLLRCFFRSPPFSPPGCGSYLSGSLDSRFPCHLPAPPAVQPKHSSSNASCTRFFSDNCRPTCRINATEMLSRISMARFVFSHPCRSAVAF